MNVTVWGRAGCGPCLAVKAALKAKGVTFTPRDLSEATRADAARWHAKGLHGTSAPVVETDTFAFAGFLPAEVARVADTCYTVSDGGKR